MEDVLGLKSAQLLVLINYIIEEAIRLSPKQQITETSANKEAASQSTNQISLKSTNQEETSKSSNQANSKLTNQDIESKSPSNEISGSVRKRMDLLKSCVAGREDRVRVLVDHIETKIKTDRSVCNVIDSKNYDKN